MDIGRKNLDVLAEEEDEEESIGSDAEQEEDIRLVSKSAELNKFDMLCDGVTNAVAYVNTSLDEYLEMKDELLQHALPPSLLTRIVLVTGKLFRSVSDLGMPVNELLRLVRVYSIPWEEKSAALKKLHEDYERKQRSLNIAIRQLKLLDAQSRRMAHERRILNWEKLFTKVTSSRGHGRRWKFLIENFKDKAKQGLEHLQEFTQSFDDSESEDGGEEDEIPDAVQTADEHGDQVGDSQSESDSDDEEEQADDGTASVRSHNKPPQPTIVVEEIPAVPVIETKDNSVWTQEPDYERFLYMKVLCPSGLAEHTNIRCSVSYNGITRKTASLELPKQDDPPPPAQNKPMRGRGLIGLRARGGLTRRDTSQPPPDPKFEEFWFLLTESEKNHIRVAVTSGEDNEIFGMATIDMDDLKILELPTVDLQEPLGDAWEPQPEEKPSEEEELKEQQEETDEDVNVEELSEGEREIIEERKKKKEQEKQEKERLREEEMKKRAEMPEIIDDGEKIIKGIPETSFPVYAITPSSGDSLHKPIADLNLVCCWGRRLKPPAFDRKTGTASIYDVVMDITGFDMRKVTKEDLHKPTEERAFSALSLRSNTEEQETVAKEDYEKIVKGHQEEVKRLNDDYAARLQELTDIMTAMEEDYKQQLAEYDKKLSRSATRRWKETVQQSKETETPRTGSSVSNAEHIPPPPPSARRRSPVEETPRTEPKPPRAPKATQPKPRPQKNFRIGKKNPKWGEGVPNDFFERLEKFHEQSQKHREENEARTLQQVRETIEKTLEQQKKTSRGYGVMRDSTDDVCLPAVFMPFHTGTVFNPRAHQYFHPTGSTDVRLTQPPSMLQLPPIPMERERTQPMPTVNLFDLSQNFYFQGPQLPSRSQTLFSDGLKKDQSDLYRPYSKQMSADVKPEKVFVQGGGGNVDFDSHGAQTPDRVASEEANLQAPDIVPTEPVEN